jgi:hypothetical protein
MLSELEPEIGPEKDSESTTDRTRNLELDSWAVLRLRRDAHHKIAILIKPCTRNASTLGTARWPLSVALIVMTGAVKAVTGDVTTG